MQVITANKFCVCPTRGKRRDGRKTQLFVREPLLLFLLLLFVDGSWTDHTASLQSNNLELIVSYFLLMTIMETTSHSQLSHSKTVKLTVTEILVETLVDGGERLQCPILTCGGQTSDHLFY